MGACANVCIILFLLTFFIDISLGRLIESVYICDVNKQQQAYEKEL